MEQQGQCGQGGVDAAIAAGSRETLGAAQISDRERKVMEFQRRFGCPAPARLLDRRPPGTMEGRRAEAAANAELYDAAETLSDVATTLGDLHRRVRETCSVDDQRLLRAKLMVSELSETLSELAQRNEVGVLDGLADLEYVTIGTATTLDLPLGAAFNEVHESNMTKTPDGVSDHSGTRGKGPGFSPPNLSHVIHAHRAARGG